jgi:hypothetical protein
MSNDNEIDPSQIQPFEVQNALVFLGGPQYDSAGQNAVYGMVTGCRSFTPGLERSIEIRRVLTRAPRMQTQLQTFVENLHRTSLAGVGQEKLFGVGWAFRDQGGWGLGVYYQNCRFVRAYMETSTSMLLVAEDVLVVSYENEVDITEYLQRRVHLVSAGDMPRTPPSGRITLG